jgi:hypothetical protein
MQDWQERIEKQQEHLEERLKKVEEQQNKPINLTVEHRYPDIELLQEVKAKQTDLEHNQHALRQELHTHSETWLDALQQNFDENRADIANIKATLSDHSEALKHTATKEDITRLEATMATKQDIARLEAGMSSMASSLAAIQQMLQDKS